MKTLKLTSIALAGAMLVLSACKNDNSNSQEPQTSLKVTPTELSFEKEGGKKDLALNASNPWKAEVDADWCTVSQSSGDKDAFITVMVQTSTSKSATTATIKFSDTKGNTATVIVKREGTGDKPGPEPTNVTDINGKIYPIIKLGNQYWMAENLACTKYDTQSEAYKAGFYEIKTSDKETDAPYYTDGRDKSKWGDTFYAGNLSSEQIRKLGLLYNWAAAMGYKTAQEAELQKDEYAGVRQGICPNGWHIPSIKEWETMAESIGGVCTRDESPREYPSIGYNMKTLSGWYDYYEGDNASGFSALPAGLADGAFVSYVGSETSFWTSAASGRGSAWDYGFLMSQKNYLSNFPNDKSDAISVRCVWN